ncbi:MAG: N-acetyltransferase family protein [Myxococcota bacterium]|nr:N-acetyltransferase family protein [Myxococcota bacterium]
MTSSPAPVVIRAVVPADAAAVAAIYEHYVAETIVTFEEERVGAAEMARRIGEVTSAGLPWLVAEERDGIVGYAYATRWRARSGYRFSVEVTVYLAPEQTGRGLGSQLYGELFPRLAALGVHAVIGGIALPNAGSVALHEKLGMQKVAHFREVGFKLGRWIDVGYWERIL